MCDMPLSYMCKKCYEKKQAKDQKNVTSYLYRLKYWDCTGYLKKRNLGFEPSRQNK